MNKISGVTVTRAALAGESSARELEIAEDSHNHFVIPIGMEGSLNHSIRDSSTPFSGVYPASSGAQNDRQTIKIKALAFADFCKQNKIKKISLMKLDIEGGEYEVFESMSEADLSIVKYVILEYHMGREKSREVEEKLRTNGFAVQIFPSKFDKTMGFMFGHNKRSLK